MDSRAALLVGFLTLAGGCSSGDGSGGGSGGGGGDNGRSGGEGDQPSAGGGGAGGEGGVPDEGGAGGLTALGGAAGGAAGGNTPSQGGAAGGSGGSTPPIMVPVPTCNPPALSLTRVTQAEAPMDLAQPPGDDRLFIVERAGRIRILRGKTLVPAAWLDIRSSVVPPAGDNERGLLALAFHPKHAENQRFFILYTRRDSDPLSSGKHGDLVIAEGKTVAGSDKAAAGITVLRVIPHHYDDYHNGGLFAFGPDGLLYLGVGDSGEDGWGVLNEANCPKPCPAEKRPVQIPGPARDLQNTLGKILRIDVDRPGEKPAGNMANADRHVWAYGVRNPFRGSFDRLTGDLYFGDVGEHSYEEIDFLPAGRGAGTDFGWGLNEGTQCFPFDHQGPCPAVGRPPIHEYLHDGPGLMTDPKSFMGKGRACWTQGCAAAVVGGYVYRGKKITGLSGRYLFGDHVRNKIFSFVAKDEKATCFADLTSDLKTSATPIQGLTSFAEDAAGELYLLDSFGNVYRLDPG
jgi:glucose/arabinose dehydrogenase